jgi:hypothetical protein
MREFSCRSKRIEICALRKTNKEGGEHQDEYVFVRFGKVKGIVYLGEFVRGESSTYDSFIGNFRKKVPAKNVSPAADAIEGGLFYCAGALA